MLPIENERFWIFEEIKILRFFFIIRYNLSSCFLMINFIIKFQTAFGESFQLYTHSYLGVGLMSAREALFGGPPAEQGAMTTVSFIAVKTLIQSLFLENDWTSTGGLYYEIVIQKGIFDPKLCNNKDSTKKSKGQIQARKLWKSWFLLLSYNLQSKLFSKKKLSHNRSNFGKPSFIKVK